MGDEINRLIEQRQLRRALIDILAQPLTGGAKEKFLSSAEAKLNRDLPAPSRHHMKMYLRAVD